jgi:type IV pilus assembly protein PilO
MDPRVEKILNLPAYQKALLILVLVLALGAGFYFGLYQNQLAEYDKLSQKKASAQALLEKNQKIANNLKVYKAEYEQLQQDLQAALSKLPEKKEIPTLLTSIGALAKEKGLDILRFKPEGEVPKGFYAEVPVSLALVGSYHDLALFFEAVGNLSRIVNIQRLKLGNAKHVDGKTSLSIDCRAITFRFVDQQPVQPKKGKKRR